MEKINKPTKLIAVMSLLFVFGISELFAQEITLQPNRRENTYKTWNVNGIVDIQIRDAKDRGKALEGNHKLKYKCKKDSGYLLKDIELTAGSSKRLRDICAKIIAEVINKANKDIALREGAGTNGFTVKKEGDSYYFRTNNVIDPDTNKPLEGSKKIRLSFYSDYKPSLLFTVYRGGGSRNRLRREFLARIEADELERRVIELESAKIILDVSRMSNPTDDSSNGKTKSDSTNNSATSSKSSSAISDAATVSPVRADSAVSKKDKSTSNDKSLSENEDTASNESGAKTVKLVKNTSKNGYKTWKKGDIFYFQAINVFDSITQKLLEKLRKLRYRCSSNDGSVAIRELNISFSRGNSQRVAIACAITSDPQILILDEPYPN